MRFDARTSLLFPVLLLIVLLMVDIGALGYFVLRDFQEDLAILHTQHAEAYAYRVYAEVVEALDSSRTGDLVEIASQGGALHISMRAVLDRNPSILSCAVLDDQARVLVTESRNDSKRRWQATQTVEVPLYHEEAQIGTIQLKVSTVLDQNEAQELRDLLSHRHLTALLVAVGLAAGTFFLIGHAVSNIRRLDARLEAANRLSLIGTISASLAHEIRSPLNAIRVNVQMVREEVEALSEGVRPDVGALIEGVERSVARLNDLLSGFLRAAREPEIRRTEVGINALADVVLQFVAPDCHRRRVDIQRAFGDDLPPISGDPDLLKQMLFNLVQNGIQAMPDGGRLSVETAWVPREERRKWWSRSLTVPAGWVTLSVSDTGEGIPAPLLGKVFDLFYTTKREGTGLGLSIVSRIASGHGGEVDAKSRPGEGTTFTVRLPV